MKKILLFILLVFSFAVNLFAKDRAIVFFFETTDGLSQKTVKKIIGSKNFSFTAGLDVSKELPEYVHELIAADKLEPTLILEPEPYLPVLSSEIKINDSMSVDRTKDLKKMLSSYNEKIDGLFEKEKYGLFLDDFYATGDTFKYFNKYNIAWCAFKYPADIKRGIYMQDGVVVFAPYTDFPSDHKKIEKWLLQRKEKIIPVYLTAAQIKNEQFTEYLADIFKNSKYTDVLTPSDVIELLKQDKKEDIEDFVLPEQTQLPQEILVKIAIAGREADEQENSALYENIYDEFLNMCSTDIIKGIIKNDDKSLMLFNISYSNIFKLSDKEIPASDMPYITAENENAGQSNCDIQNKFGFEKNEDGYILQNSTGAVISFAVKKTDKSVDFTVIADDADAYTVDIYIDMNGLPDAGCGVMLKGVDGFFAQNNYWEYAVRLTKEKAVVYRFYVDDLTVVKNIVKNGNTVSIPSDVLRGNPYNWGYQAVALKDNKVIDFLAAEKEKGQIKNTQPLQLQMLKCE